MDRILITLKEHFDQIESRARARSTLAIQESQNDADLVAFLFKQALEEIQKVEQSHDIDLVRVQESVTQVQNLLAETKEMMSEMRNSARTEKESILRELREETRRVTSEVVSNALTSATVSVAQGTPQLRMSVAAVLETGAETIRAMPEADGGNPNVQ